MTSSTASSSQSISFWQAFAFWLKLGFISFGGPAGQISVMQQELVERRRWIAERRFLHALNYCMLLPGPEAQQLATYIGWLMHRTWGGIVAGALFVLPSLLILIGLSWVYIVFGEMPLVADVFYGIKPAVTAIVVQAAHRIGPRALKNHWLWGIAAASFIAIFAANVPFPLIVAAAALVGYLGGRLVPEKFKADGGHGQADKRYGPALIDDDTPTPEHARFRWMSLLQVVVVGVILNLALFFGYHVLWPAGFGARFDWVSALIALGAAIALFRFKRNVIHVIAGCAVVGFLVKTMS